MDTAVLIEDLNRVYGWDLTAAGTARGLSEGVSMEGVLEDLLAEKINSMIQRDFGALVQLLYRIDVSEDRLRRILNADTGEDAGRIIARLIMERQWQKIESRRRFRQEDAARRDGAGRSGDAARPDGAPRPDDAGRSEDAPDASDEERW